ncbi:hypothetical protein LEP1GSC168_0234 [Leptospira santarosai str. HAI134]|uniref:Uncharacterized protein n=2 Tax=Leptospira santarosai TaxID=28183 RepID=M6UQF6_9LEPT|nr:hypothetical protein LEP1GSC168_0234 [Leptospira santarosai str. HAI134]EMO46830.1 hypothetical protein LEP1GSC187_2253 [Leptospira santarosai str. ZUN179]
MAISITEDSIHKSYRLIKNPLKIPQKDKKRSSFRENVPRDII